jgi:hypothetical protein
MNWKCIMIVMTYYKIYPITQSRLDGELRIQLHQSLQIIPLPWACTIKFSMMGELRYGCKFIRNVFVVCSVLLSLSFLLALATHEHYKQVGVLWLGTTLPSFCVNFEVAMTHFHFKNKCCMLCKIKEV